MIFLGKFNSVIKVEALRCANKAFARYTSTGATSVDVQKRAVDARSNNENANLESVVSSDDGFLAYEINAPELLEALGTTSSPSDDIRKKAKLTFRKKNGVRSHGYKFRSMPLCNTHGTLANSLILSPSQAMIQGVAHAHRTSNSENIPHNTQRFESAHTKETVLDFECPLPHKIRQLSKNEDRGYRKMDCASLKEEGTLESVPKRIACKPKIEGHKQLNSCGVIFECPKKKLPPAKKDCTSFITVLGRREILQVFQEVLGKISNKFWLNPARVFALHQIIGDASRVDVAHVNCTAVVASPHAVGDWKCEDTPQRQKPIRSGSNNDFHTYSEMKRQANKWSCRKFMQNKLWKQQKNENLRISDAELLRLSLKHTISEVSEFSVASQVANSNGVQGVGKPKSQDQLRVIAKIPIQRTSEEFLTSPGTEATPENKSFIWQNPLTLKKDMGIVQANSESAKDGGPSSTTDHSSKGFKPKPGQVCCPKDQIIERKEEVKPPQQICCPPTDQKIAPSKDEKAGGAPKEENIAAPKDQKVDAASKQQSIAAPRDQKVSAASKEQNVVAPRDQKIGASSKEQNLPACNYPNSSAAKTVQPIRSAEILQQESEKPNPKTQPSQREKQFCEKIQCDVSKADVKKGSLKKTKDIPTAFNCCLSIVGPRKVEVRNCPMPKIKDNNVIIKMHSCGLCTSDIYMFENGATKENGSVLGHEGSGIVYKVGKNVKHLRQGDAVAIEPGIACGVCPYCRAGRCNLCPAMKFNGLLQTYCGHPANFCHKIPREVNLTHAALTHPLAMALHACRKARVCVGSNVLILGACPLGLSTVMAARAMGADKIVIMDTSEKNLQVAFDLCADKTILATPEMSDEILAEKVCADFRGNPNVVIDCCGCTKTINLAAMALKPGGYFILAGCQADCVNVPILTLLAKEIRACASFRTCNEFVNALSMIKTQRANVEKLITHKTEFCDSQQAFNEAGDEVKSGAIKVVVFWPQAGKK